MSEKEEVTAARVKGGPVLQFKKFRYNIEVETEMCGDDLRIVYRLAGLHTEHPQRQFRVWVVPMINRLRWDLGHTDDWSLAETRDWCWHSKKFLNGVLKLHLDSDHLDRMAKLMEIAPLYDEPLGISLGIGCRQLLIKIGNEHERLNPEPGFKEKGNFV